MEARKFNDRQPEVGESENRSVPDKPGNCRTRKPMVQSPSENKGPSGHPRGPSIFYVLAHSDWVVLVHSEGGSSPSITQHRAQAASLLKLLRRTAQA